MIYTELFVLLILVLLNAYFALTEISVVSASKPLLKHYVKQGNKRAQYILEITESPGRFLSTIQLGITLVGILAGAYGGATIAEKISPYFMELPYIGKHGESLAVVLIVSFITYFSVLGEIIPKRFALSHPEKISMACAGSIKIMMAILYPIVVFLEGSATALMKIMGIFSESEDLVTEEEFKAVLSEGADSGVIEKTEHEMLQRVIRLDDRDVKSIMTHRTEVVFIDINDSVEEIRKKVHEAGHSRYPVIDGSADELRGIVQAKELLDSALGDAREINVMQHVKDVLILPESASCLQALESFKKNHINIIVIVDEYGSTQGIVTSSDILEAIVGTLPSNYDHGDQMKIVERADGSWLVDGRTPIEEIHLSIGLDQISADEDFDTIAGFVLEHLRKTPKEGAKFEIFNHRFEIVDMDSHRIDKILITKLAPPEEE